MWWRGRASRTGRGSPSPAGRRAPPRTARAGSHRTGLPAGAGRPRCGRGHPRHTAAQLMLRMKASMYAVAFAPKSRWYACSYMSSTSTGAASTAAWEWSARHLVPELPRLPAVREGHPARPVGEGLRRLDELAAPGPDAPEVLLEAAADRIRELVPLPAQVAEVQLVERHGTHRGQLLALERAEPVVRRAGVQGGQLSPDGVQRPDRAPVVVLVVADQRAARRGHSASRVGPRSARSL